MSVRLLVIDDDLGICRFIARALQLRGYDVDICDNADEGVDRLLQGSYQLALIDIQMPNWSGVEACRSLRSHAATRALPVILMTAFYEDDEDLQAAREKSGATAFLLKPFTLEKLFSSIETLIGSPTTKPLEDTPVIDGDLALTAMPQLLHNLYTLKATGLLHLEQGEVRKVVYCRNGYPIFARSNLLRECLGRMLVREGHLSEADCEESLRRMKETGRLQGTVLMEMGILSPHELHEALRIQVTEKLLEVFAWTGGTFRFLPAGQFKKGVTAIDLSPATLIHEGVKRYWEPLKVAAFLESYADHYLTATANPHYRFQNMELSDRDAEVLAECRGELRISDLLKKHPLARLEVEQLLAALLMARIIEPVEQPLPHSSDELSEEPQPIQATGLREIILADHRRMLAQDYFSLLGISRETGADGLRSAYYALAAKHHPDRYVHAHLSADLQTRVDEIFQHLRQAYETLSEAARRRQYLETLEGRPTTSVSAPKPTPQADVVAGAEAFRKGQGLLGRGDYAKALPYLEQALAVSPDEPEYLSACAWARYWERPEDPQRIAQARDMLLRSAGLEPGLDVTHLYLGYLLRHEGREQDAVRRFEMAVMCNPECSAALKELQIIEERRAKLPRQEGLLRRWFGGGKDR